MYVYTCIYAHTYIYMFKLSSQPKACGYAALELSGTSMTSKSLWIIFKQYCSLLGGCLNSTNDTFYLSPKSPLNVATRKEEAT